MKKFILSYQFENNVVFTLKIQEELEVSFDIVMEPHTGEWTFLAGKSVWNAFSFSNGEFQAVRGEYFENFTPQESILINNGFYELMKQLKEDSTWRLKIMHLLNDESRKIWDKV